MMRKLKYVFVLSMLTLNCPAYSQIVDPGADYAMVTYSPVVDDSTFIFVYFSSNTDTPVLKAKSMDSNRADFQWFRFDTSTKKIDPAPVLSDNGKIESKVSVSEGGYMVVIATGTVVDTFRAWVFYDEIKVDSVVYTQNCEYLQLTAYASSNRNSFFYYDYSDFCDLDNIVERYISNTYTVEWDSDTDIYEGLTNVSQSWKMKINSMITRISSANEPPDADRSLVPRPSAPFKDAKYSVKVKNLFGNVTAEYKTGLIPARGLYAKFDVLVPDDYGVFVPTTDLDGEALWRMKLDNKSVNADKFEWIGLNDQNINFLQNDTLWRYNTENVPDEIVYRPGKYPVKLSVENTGTGCRHSTYALDASGKRKDINVAPSIFSPESLPNAFTPNGDGNNDFFTFVKGKEPMSMRIMDLKIISRNSTPVYKYKGEVSSWEGWNGKMNGNGSDCSSGVYYYIISGEGWDGKSYSGKNYTGVLHLFRGK